MTSQPPSDVNSCISRIAHGLLPEPSLRSESVAPRTLAERLDYYKVPGVSIAVINNYAVEWSRAYGLRDASNPVTVETRFQAASISKSVAATAALRLVEQGRLRLDEDVNTYLRSWKIPTNDGWQARVTLRQILSHTAGLTVHGFPGYAQGNALPTLLQILDGVAPANTSPIRVDTLPGLQHRYSGGGYCVLQQLLIDITGTPFPELMRELVLGPLGMEHSAYAQPLPPDQAVDAAMGHPMLNTTPLGGGCHVYPELAAAGLWTTPTDLARFAIALQRAWAGQQDTLLSQATVKEMLTPQVEDYIGLGVFLGGKDQGAFFGHSGWNEGFVCKFEAFVNGGKGAVIMTNGQSGSPLYNEIFRAIAHEYAWPDYSPAQRAVIAVDQHVQAAYEGTYEIKPNLRLVVAATPRGLDIQCNDQLPIAFTPESETAYFAQPVNTTVSFVQDQAGRVEAIVIQQNNTELRAQKV